MFALHILDILPSIVIHSLLPGCCRFTDTVQSVEGMLKVVISAEGAEECKAPRNLTGIMAVYGSP